MTWCGTPGGMCTQEPLPGVKELVADLEVGAALEHVERLERLDVVVGARLEAGLAVFFHHFEGPVGVCAGDLDDDFVRLGVDVALAGR